MTTLAITGGTGFVGAHLLNLAVSRGFAVRALTRRPQTERAGVTWVEGALHEKQALSDLVQGADAIMHVAGVINARDRSGFAAGNINGTEAMLAVARDAGVSRFVHVSSLAAREPALSAYGWSKLVSEQRVQQAAAVAEIRTTIVRPPAVYGPGDREVLEFFRMARSGLVLLPPAGRLSVIAVEDLCRLLLDLIDRPETIGAIYEPDDGAAQGYTHAAFAHMLGDAVGRRVRPIAVPAPLLRLAAAADGLVRRTRAKLTPDRVAYFSHPDWVSAPQARVPAAVWRPQVETAQGLRATADWYRAQGWLKP